MINSLLVPLKYLKTPERRSHPLSPSITGMEEKIRVGI